MPAPRYRDTSLERRRAAAANVDRHLDELHTILDADGVKGGIVDGSAVAAEVYLAETNTLHTAIRVAVFVAAPDRRDLERALQRAGFDRSEPSGDVHLLRLAGRGGRRAVHVLFEPDAAADGEPAHPASVEGSRARARRLASAWIEPAATFIRAHLDADETHDISESFEIQLIEQPAAVRDGVLPRDRASC
ncbi:MAG: hypothetical protein ACYTGC_14135 [Planctomycetota bacterium]|jgi:hypothetical protein